MTITPEQKLAVEQAGGQPVRVEDPETHATYIILKAEVYDRIRTRPLLQEGPGSPEIPDGILRSRQAFLAALPELLRRHPGRWACFHAGERVGIARDKTSLVRQCVGRGIEDDYVGMIVPSPAGDEFEVIDDSLFESDEFTPSP